jgi:nucleotide-binding universal stress UspA family protein
MCRPGIELAADQAVANFRNILCPIDFSPCSRHALTVATELAKSSEGSLTIAHVWQTPAYGSPDAPLSGDVIQSYIDDAERSLADWTAIATANGVSARSKLVRGVAWNEIVRFAADSQTDLIVMGTHGRTGLKHVLIGSVAEKVVRHAPCAVLVLR